MIRSNRRAGFTMVDLIVCIVIGLFAFALIVPAIANARQKARQQNCAFQIHQTEMGIQICKDELVLLDQMEAALNNTGSDFYRACEEKGEVETTRSQIKERRRVFTAELRRLEVELGKWKTRQLEENPMQYGRMAR
jgi:hypothetical protein